MDIMQAIREEYSSFSKKERQIADFVLQNSEEVKSTNIVKLAQQIGVSGGTITRFCKRIGCENFVDMKLKLSQIRAGEDNEADNSVLDEVYTFYSKIMRNTKESIELDEVYTLGQSLKQAANIYIYGVGSSGMSATEFGLRLLRMGLNAMAITDSHMMRINGSISKKNDVVIGISNSGATHDIVTALEMSRANGAFVVTFTCFSNTPVSNLGDQCFYVYNSNFINDERFINSQVGIKYLIDVISTVLLEDAELSANMKKTRDAIAGKHG